MWPGFVGQQQVVRADFGGYALPGALSVAHELHGARRRDVGHV